MMCCSGIREYEDRALKGGGEERAVKEMLREVQGRAGQGMAGQGGRIHVKWSELLPNHHS